MLRKQRLDEPALVEIRDGLPGEGFDRGALGDSNYGKSTVKLARLGASA